MRCQDLPAYSSIPIYRLKITDMKFFNLYQTITMYQYIGTTMIMLPAFGIFVIAVTYPISIYQTNTNINFKIYQTITNTDWRHNIIQFFPPILRVILQLLAAIDFSYGVTSLEVAKEMFHKNALFDITTKLSNIKFN